MTRERGLICCAEMVKAFLEGRKTQMRRLIDLSPDVQWEYSGPTDDGLYKFTHFSKTESHLVMGHCFRKPHYQIGDHLYFMPKDFARQWLEVVAVKDPHRIQSISPEDCISEGSYMATDYDDEGGFVNLWDRLHPKLGERWEDSPWVFPYVVKKIERGD